MNKPYKVIKVGYGPTMEKYKYSNTKGIRYIEVLDRNTELHYIFPSYLTLGYAFGKMDSDLLTVYNASCEDEDDEDFDDSEFLIVDDFFVYDD